MISTLAFGALRVGALENSPESTNPSRPLRRGAQRKTPRRDQPVTREESASFTLREPPAIEADARFFIRDV